MTFLYLFTGVKDFPTKMKFITMLITLIRFQLHKNKINRRIEEIIVLFSIYI